MLQVPIFLKMSPSHPPSVKARCPNKRGKRTQCSTEPTCLPSIDSPVLLVTDTWFYSLWQRTQLLHCISSMQLNMAPWLSSSLWDVSRNCQNWWKEGQTADMCFFHILPPAPCFLPGMLMWKAGLQQLFWLMRQLWDWKAKSGRRER